MERKYVIDIVEDDSSIRNIEALAMKKNGFAVNDKIISVEDCAQELLRLIKKGKND